MIQPNEYNMEIESLFKALNAQNSMEIKPHGILECLNKPSNFLNQCIRKELEYMHKKVKIVLPVQAAPPAIEDAKGSNSPSNNEGS
jgi:hypothetical protein